MTSLLFFTVPEGFVAVPVDLKGFPLKDTGDINEAMADWWRLVTEKQALQKGFYTLKCVICGKLARQVDGHFPYETDYSRCEDHLRATRCPKCGSRKCYTRIEHCMPRWTCSECLTVWSEPEEVARLNHLYKTKKVKWTPPKAWCSWSGAKSAESGSSPSSPTVDSPKSATSPPAVLPTTNEGEYYEPEFQEVTLTTTPDNKLHFQEVELTAIIEGGPKKEQSQ